MFTPQEVSEKTFPKASGFNNGYGMAAVDEVLDALTEDYTALYKDNAALKAKLKVLAEKVEEYRATEDAMRSTLLSAQRMAAQMVSDAQAQRDKMLSDAQEVTIEVVGGRGDASANFDMQSLKSLQHGDRILVTRADHSVHFLHPKGWNYFDTLRKKLGWNEGGV